MAKTIGTMGMSNNTNLLLRSRSILCGRLNSTWLFSIRVVKLI